MSSEKVQEKLANSCNRLSEVSNDLPDVSVWLDTTEVERCNNLIANNTEEICDFEKKTFGLARRDNNREFKKTKLKLQKDYEKQANIINAFYLELRRMRALNDVMMDIKKKEFRSIYRGAYEFIYKLNSQTEKLKQKIVDLYPSVENSQYKVLLTNYKKIKDNISKIEKQKDNNTYLDKRLQNKIIKLTDKEKVNHSIKITIGVLFVIGIILALLYRFL
tara:strand:+ start:333 stop:989 length:657 start_codon:yes stop_codon:yes gene_type:complete